jgi:hypothetical protein
MKILPLRLLPILVALLVVSGCAGDEQSGAPVLGISQSCERSCNTEYDTCIGRFGGISSPGLGGHGDSGTASLGPNNLCPDQLKSCFKRCTP